MHGFIEKSCTESYTSYKGSGYMIHTIWATKPTTKTVTCSQTDAKKFLVSNVLTVGKTYEVKNETEEFIFVIDNTGKVGGYYKEYFQ